MLAKRKRAPPVMYRKSSARGDPRQDLAEDPISSLSSDESPREPPMKILCSPTSESSCATTEYEESSWGEEDDEDGWLVTNPDDWWAHLYGGPYYRD